MSPDGFDSDKFLRAISVPASSPRAGESASPTTTPRPGSPASAGPGAGGATMPNPIAVLDFGQDDEVSVREVLSRLAVFVGGPLTEALLDLPAGVRVRRVVTEISHATSYLDDALDTYDLAFPPAPQDETEAF